MISNPEGAYSQLVLLQEGNAEKEKKPSSQVEMDAEKSFTRNPSKRTSFNRSTSKGSSGSRRSFSVGFGIPGVMDMLETDEEVDDHEETESDKMKGQNVSIRRLASLNKPEFPILIIGSVAAAVHGVIFPIFGLLLSSSINMFYKPPDQLRKDANFWALIYLAMGILVLVAVPFQNYFFGIAGGQLIKRIRYLTFQKIVHQQISYFDDPANSRYARHILRNVEFGKTCFFEHSRIHNRY